MWSPPSTHSRRVEAALEEAQVGADALRAGRHAHGARSRCEQAGGQRGNEVQYLSQREVREVRRDRAREAPRAVIPRAAGRRFPAHARNCGLRLATALGAGLRRAAGKTPGAPRKRGSRNQAARLPSGCRICGSRLPAAQDCARLGPWASLRLQVRSPPPGRCSATAALTRARGAHAQEGDGGNRGRRPVVVQGAGLLGAGARDAQEKHHSQGGRSLGEHSCCCCCCGRRS